MLNLEKPLFVLDRDVMSFQPFRSSSSIVCNPPRCSCARGKDFVESAIGNDTSRHLMFPIPHEEMTLGTVLLVCRKISDPLSVFFLPEFWAHKASKEQMQESPTR